MAHPLRVGYFNSDLDEEWAGSAWMGMVRWALAHGVGLVTFIGGRMGRDHPANAVYALGAQGFDGHILWPGNLTNHLSTEEFQDYTAQRLGGPLVTMEGHLAGVPQVTIANREGLTKILDHLIEDHAFRRIGYIGFLGNHEGFKNRFQAFLEEMEAKGLDVDPAFLLPWIPEEHITGNSEFDAGFVRSWLETALSRGVEAIVAASDPVALQTMDLLETMGIRVPGQVAITGFDGFILGKIHSPTLTSLDPGWTTFGAKALETMVSRISGDEVPLVTTVPAHLIVGHSCGCMAQGQEDGALPDREPFLRASVAEAMGLNQPDQFLQTYGAALETATRQGENLLLWRGGLAALGEWARETYPSRGKEIENLLNQAWVTLSGAIFRVQARKSQESIRLIQAISEVGKRLVSAFAVDQITEIMAESLPPVGIQGCFVSLFEARPAYRFPDPLPGRTRLLLWQEGGEKKALPLDGGWISTADLIPLVCAQKAPSASYLVEALTFQDRLVGIIGFEVQGTLDPTFFGYLKNQVAAGLWGALLWEERQKTEHQMMQSEKLAALGSLVAGVSHEINTPLGVALGATSYLKSLTKEFSDKLSTQQVRRSDLQTFLSGTEEAGSLLEANLERAAELVSSFKHVASDQASEIRRTFAIREYLEEILVSLKPQWKHKPIEIQVDGPLGVEVNSYPGALGQVLTNLLMNALLHAFGPQTPGTIAISVEDGQNSVSIRFQDNGSGIPADNLGRVFEPFFTTKRGTGGTGLGLAIVYNLVTQVLGGTITCQSEPGQGTRFDLRFPKVSPENDPNPATGPGSPAPRG